MNGRLVDTNVIIRFLKGHTELFSLFDDLEKLYVSSVTFGELMYGAELSSKTEFNSETYGLLCSEMKMLLPDAKTCICYGKIKSELKRKGNPIPENDIWIAATVMANDLELLTADSDFKAIDGLSVKFI